MSSAPQKKLLAAAVSIAVSIALVTSYFVLTYDGGGGKDEDVVPDPIENDELVVDDDLEPAFHSIADLEDELRDIAAEHSDITKLVSLGKTVENRDIWAMKISDNPDVEEDEPEVYFNGAHHGREWMTLEVPLYIINFLTDNYGINGTITDIVNERQVWVVPSVNPDGRVHDGINDGTDPYNHTLQPYGWRKNMRDNNGGGFSENDDGVDLNRNYGYMWGGTGASTDQGEYTYRGASAFSEPETRAIRDFARAHDFVLSISYHSYSQLILYPWGYTYAPAPDKDILHTVASEMADRITNTAGSIVDRYVPMQSSGLYMTSGDDIDWLYGELGVLAYIVELYPHIDEPLPEGLDLFHQNASLIQAVSEDNLPAAIFLMQIADNPYKVMDHLSLETDTPDPRIKRSSTQSIRLTAENDGKRDDTWTFTAEEPEGWTVQITPDTLILSQGQSANVTVTINTPANEAAGVHEVKIQASSSANSSAVFSLTLNVEIPHDNDMAVDYFDFSGNLTTQVGSYQADGRVKNIGELPASTFNISINTTKFTDYNTQTIFEDDGANGLAKWEVVDHDQQTSKSVWRNPPDGHTFPGSFSCGLAGGTRYDVNTVSSIELAEPLDLGDVSGANLSFWTKYETEFDLDFGIVEVSRNGGRTWDVLRTFTGRMTNWVNIELDLKDYVGSSQFKIRFRFTSDTGASSDDGFKIDDVLITAEKPNEVSVFSETRPATGALDYDEGIKITWILQFDTPGTYRIEITVDRPGDENFKNNKIYIIIKIY